VQADLFSDELEQARELLVGGYTAAAAVIAGVVLETTLRQLCNDNALAFGKLDGMNASLAKAGIYNQIVAKRITSIAAIRNSAAHGNPTEYQRSDVVDMLAYVSNFVGEQLA
jgi:hypothetical protein